MALIRVEGLFKRFPLTDGKGEFTVLNDVSLTVRAGEVVALLGRSGCGKSTLLRIIAGLIQPSEGRVLSHHQPLRGINRNLAMVFQSFALLPWFTVQDNVELGLAARQLPRMAGGFQALFGALERFSVGAKEWRNAVLITWRSRASGSKSR